VAVICIQVANGAGLSISHIGHSILAGSSLKLQNILHVPHISKHLLSVYRLVSDNDVFVEFHRHFFCVKTRSRGEFFFTVEAKVDSTQFLLVGRLHHLAMPSPVSRPRLLSGTSV
jgi:hypothetical protein